MARSEKPKSASHEIVFKSLTQNAVFTKTHSLDAKAAKAMARDLGLISLRKARIDITLTPITGKDWHLKGRIGATIEQICGVTLEAFTARVEADVVRSYLSRFDLPQDGESEMPEDDTLEALPDVLDLEALLSESLALEIPAFPRKPDEKLLDLTAVPQGSAPLENDKVKPFAGLADFKAQLEAEEGSESVENKPSDS